MLPLPPLPPLPSDLELPLPLPPFPFPLGPLELFGDLELFVDLEPPFPLPPFPLPFPYCLRIEVITFHEQLIHRFTIDEQ